MSPQSDPSSVRRLELTLRRRVEGVLTGEHTGLGLGSGSEAEELVAYQPGHDVRRIDWNATARAGGEPQVWLTRAEHALETWVLIDESPSMAFGSGEWEKRDVAAWAAAAFGILTGGPGDRVGVGVLSADGLRFAPPRAGRVAARRTLVAEPPVRSGSGGPSLAEALLRLDSRAPRSGLRIVITDLVDPEGEVARPFDWEAPLKRLAARHDVILVEVVDPRELDLPDVGVVAFTDPESGAQHEVSTSDRRLRARYAEFAAEHRRQTQAAVRSSCASHLVLRTDDDLARQIVRFARRRHRQPARNGRTTR